LLIAATASAPADRVQSGRDIHDSLTLSVEARYGPPEFDPRFRNGVDQNHDDDERHVQRRRRRELRHYRQPAIRQVRRARSASIDNEHDKRSGKVDTDGTSSVSAAESPGRCGDFAHASQKSAARNI
jgi:hypothetical protein